MNVSRARLAISLWIACAVAVWNVIFDRVLVLAGRRYVYAASLAARESGTYERIDDWMPAAVERGLWLATSGAGLVLVVGLVAVALAMKWDRSRLE
jgi:hypothetical protein